MRPVDLMLSDHAGSLGKKTGGLETYYRQIDMIYQLADLRVNDSTVDFADDSLLLAGMKRFYLNEQLDSVTAVINNLSPAYTGIIFGDRNRTMADSIEKYMINNSCFFAIGAGHLVGAEGVISKLRKKGFVLSPVFSSKKISMLAINNLKKGLLSLLESKQEPIDDIAAEKIETINTPLSSPPKTKSAGRKPGTTSSRPKKKKAKTNK